MTAMVAAERSSTCGRYHQMKGSITMPISEVKTSSTATEECRKYFSTRYLSMWVEMADKTGPEKATEATCVKVGWF